MILRCSKCDRTRTLDCPSDDIPLSDCCHAPSVEFDLEIEMGEKKPNCTDPVKMMPKAIGWLKQQFEDNPLLFVYERPKLAGILAILAAERLIIGRTDDEILDIYKRILGKNV